MGYCIAHSLVSSELACVVSALWMESIHFSFLVFFFEDPNRISYLKSQPKKTIASFTSGAFLLGIYQEIGSRNKKMNNILFLKKVVFSFYRVR